MNIPFDLPLPLLHPELHLCSRLATLLKMAKNLGLCGDGRVPRRRADGRTDGRGRTPRAAREERARESARGGTLIAGEAADGRTDGRDDDGADEAGARGG